jgi:hypothetical protein
VQRHLLGRAVQPPQRCGGCPLLPQRGSHACWTLALPPSPLPPPPLPPPPGRRNQPPRQLEPLPAPHARIASVRRRFGCSKRFFGGPIACAMWCGAITLCSHCGCVMAALGTAVRGLALVRRCIKRRFIALALRRRYIRHAAGFAAAAGSGRRRSGRLSCPSPLRRHVRAKRIKEAGVARPPPPRDERRGGGFPRSYFGFYDSVFCCLIENLATQNPATHASGVGDLEDLHQLLHPLGGQLNSIVQNILLDVQDAVLESLCKDHFHGIWKCHLGAIGIRILFPQPRLNVHLETRAALP